MSYKGLIVGGHLAGQWQSNDFPTFTVGHIEIEQDGQPADDPRCLHGVWVSETYVHAAAEPYGEFWVPEGKNIAWAITELTRAYRSKKSQQIDRLETSERLEHAKRKIDKIIDHLPSLCSLVATNRIVVHSNYLSKQIPLSRAGVAFSEFQRSIRHFTILRLLTLWDAGGMDKISLPTVAKLLTDPNTARERADEAFYYHRPHWGEERAKHEAEKIKLTLANAVAAVERITNGKKLAALRVLRNELIAHNLDQQRQRTQRETPKPVQRSDEIVLARLTTRIAWCFHSALNDTDYDIVSLDRKTRQAAEELWMNCRFTIGTGTRPA